MIVSLIILLIMSPLEANSHAATDLNFLNGAPLTPVTVAEMAPRQPYDAFFGECPNIVHRNGISYIVYTDPGYDVYIKAFDHSSGTISQPVFIAEGWNDHICPALLIDEADYFHVFYGARPRPVRYTRSSEPLNWADWSGAVTETIGTSGTYPIPIILGNRLFVVYREGDSDAASLSLATRDIAAPMGEPGTWSVRRILETSSSYVPMPLSAFDNDSTACFLFNIRDAYLSSPHTAVAPSVREALSVICTSDGETITDIDGIPLDIPLDYERDRFYFPVVIPEQEYFSSDPMIIENDTIDLGGLMYDGTVIDLSVGKGTYSQTVITIGGGEHTYCTATFSSSGYILLSDGETIETVSSYNPGTTYYMRLKFFLSAKSYRAWINEQQLGTLRSFTFSGAEIPTPITLDSLIVTSDETIEFQLRAGREYKLITASACIDSRGKPNYFFIDRIDSSIESYWALIHLRNGVAREIGSPDYHKYHPSCISIGDYLYAAVAHFEGEGLFTNNEHLVESSAIHLMRTGDFEEWRDLPLSEDGSGEVHPIFKRNDTSGIVELSWARMESTSRTNLEYGYSSRLDTIFCGTEIPKIPVRIFPNPFMHSTTVFLNLPMDSDVQMELYDAAGRLIKQLLAKQYLIAGEHEFRWNGDGAGGNNVPPGVYLLRIRAGNIDTSRKIILLR